jgi:endoglycosylceramidase
MRSLALACCCCLAGFAAAPARAAPTLPLGHAGRWVIDAQGRVVIVHGTNMVYKLPPYYPAVAGFGDNDAAFLARIGFNAVRVGVIWKAVEPHPGVYDDGYLRRIAATVRVLHRHGILSLLDFHQDMYNERFQGEGAPDWAIEDDGLPALPKLGFPLNYTTMPALQHTYDHFWNNSAGPGGVGLQSRYAATWRHVARRFGGEAGVFGYELFNEPFPGTAYPTCLPASGCPAFDAKLTAFNRRVAAAIRRADRRTLVWYEPNVVFNFGPATNVGALGDPRAGFAFHDYCLSASPNGCPSESKVVTNAVAHVNKTREALLLTEFGATTAVGDLSGMVRRADRNMVPWLEWAYCGCEDPTTSGPGAEQAIVIDPRKRPAGSNLVSGTLHTLVEPYPQVVAGTPRSWGFEPASRTFRLAFTIGRASGHGRFPAGSLTEIATPSLVYNGRYAAVVRGGAIVSRSGAGALVVASCPGARSVSVAVAPSGRSRGSCIAATRR